ncbi:hypothetical protein DPMN_105734 [Dreissena polymorpha]|uniref:Uncharacterized protein n=1 Tax=Dreissena polymorpha TaxID=45954 RepID=A0A9D4K3Q2_DREPO|nr:hypothetical protein DPMN_105734 [Dreissena polymorpha]
MVTGCRYPFSGDQTVSEPDWEVYLRETAHMIVQQQSPKRWVSQNTGPVRHSNQAMLWENRSCMLSVGPDEPVQYAQAYQLQHFPH